MTHTNASTNAFAPRNSGVVLAARKHEFTLFTFYGDARFDGNLLNVTVTLYRLHAPLFNEYQWDVRTSIVVTLPSGTKLTMPIKNDVDVQFKNARDARYFADKQVRTLLRSWSNQQLAHQVSGFISGGSENVD